MTLLIDDMTRFEIIRLSLFILAFIAVGVAIVLIFGQETKQKDAKVPETENWYTYKNEQYGFDMRYPSTVEPLEGKAFFFGSNALDIRLDICFAPGLREEFDCEFEFYIVENPLDNLLTKELFIGLERCPKDKKFVPHFGRIEGKEVDTCADGDLMYRNAVAVSRHGVLIFSTEPSAGHTIAKNETYEAMLGTFRFIR